MEEHHTPSSGLIYGLDDRPPFREALFAALQHALPTERYQAALNLSSQALMGWMQARRAATE